MTYVAVHLDSVMPQLEFTKTVRLAVSDDVWLTKLETDIIDTPLFQRLRQIKQLGPSVWVYPTALHTRFDHSIGVLAAADAMVEAIMSARAHVRAMAGHNAEDITVSQRKLARLYGLLHDISHAPFGHTLEDELQVFSSHDEFQDKGRKSKRFTVPLGSESDIGKLIISQEGEEFYQRFSNIVLKGKSDRLEVLDDGRKTADEFVYHLVSNTVCADLIDYLQRDNYFCNLGLRAPVRVMNYLYVTDVKQENDELRRRVVIRLWKSLSGDAKGRARRDILTDLAGLLDARYMLAERVYFHPAKLIVGTMIGRAALEAKRAGQLDEIRLFEFGDDTLLDFIARLPELRSLEEADEQARVSASLASQLARAVIGRQLYRREHSYQIEDFAEGTDDRLPSKEELHAALSDAEDRAAHEDEIANIAGVQPGDVLIYLGPENMNMKVAEAIIDWRGHRKKLSELSREDDPVLVDRLDSIKKSHIRLWSVDLFIKRGISDDRREIIRTAFEAKFLPRKERHTRWFSVLSDLMTTEPLGNVKHADIIAASRAAAHDLSSTELEEIPAHGQTPREWLISLVKERVQPTSDGR